MKYFCDHSGKKTKLKHDDDEDIFDQCPKCKMYVSHHNFWEDHHKVEKQFTSEDIDKIVDQICEPYGNHITEVVLAGGVIKKYLSESPPAKTQQDSETSGLIILDTTRMSIDGKYKVDSKTEGVPTHGEATVYIINYHDHGIQIMAYSDDEKYIRVTDFLDYWGIWQICKTPTPENIDTETQAMEYYSQRFQQGRK